MLQKAIQRVFSQLTASLDQLDETQYAKCCLTLCNASIGKHVRHVIELFQSLEAGYAVGVINYENRKRDARIENDKKLALSLLWEIHDHLNKPDKEITLEYSCDEDPAALISIKTNYNRELAYGLEHTIHHMALIRVGINEVAAIRLPENYGVAFSTIKHRQTCVQ